MFNAKSKPYLKTWDLVPEYRYIDYTDSSIDKTVSGYEPLFACGNKNGLVKHTIDTISAILDTILESISKPH